MPLLIGNHTEKNPDNDFVMSLYEKYSKRILGYAYKMTHDIMLTQDIIQAVFLIIINKVEKLKQLPDDEIAPYIFTIVRNESLHKLKANEREVIYEFIDDVIASELDVEEHVIENIEIGIVKKILAQLPERFRMVIMLKYWMDFSHKEIGQEMRISESSSQNLLAKAIATLRKQLSEVINNEQDPR